jgi:hypothetical protein
MCHQFSCAAMTMLIIFLGVLYLSKNQHNINFQNCLTQRFKTYKKLVFFFLLNRFHDSLFFYFFSQVLRFNIIIIFVLFLCINYSFLKFILLILIKVNSFLTMVMLILNMFG